MRFREIASTSIIALAVTTMTFAPIASANDPVREDSAGATADGQGVVVQGTGAPHGAGKRRAATLVDCKQFSVDAVVASTESREHGLQPYLVPGYTNEQVGRATGWLRCQKVNGGGSVGFLTGLNAPPVPAIATVVALAEAKVHLDPPAIATSPPRRGPQLVSVPIWFWSTDQPVTQSAAIPGLAATLTVEQAQAVTD
ncbi:MAG: hypothetical protein JWM47_810 [Acidimicrobiales bacterium]|nr:hypothetical protein [Acidimicrobiales bacterium]